MNGPSYLGGEDGGVTHTSLNERCLLSRGCEQKVVAAHAAVAAVVAVAVGEEAGEAAEDQGRTQVAQVFHHPHVLLSLPSTDVRRHMDIVIYCY